MIMNANTSSIKVLNAWKNRTKIRKGIGATKSPKTKRAEKIAVEKTRILRCKKTGEWLRLSKLAIGNKFLTLRQCG